MKYFVNDAGIGAADPEEIRAQARRLTDLVTNIERVARLLRAVSVRGVWDAPSGDTFAAKVDDTPGRLDEVAHRLCRTAEIIRPYADLLEATQQAVAGHDDDASVAHSTIRERDSQLEMMAPDDPERHRVERERGRAAVALARAESGFEEELEEAHADESRMAAKLNDVAAQVGDPVGYDVFEGLSTLGRHASRVGIIARPLALVGVGDPIGKAGRRIFYDEGSYADVARSSVGFGLDTVSFGAGRVVKGFKSRSAGAPRVNTPPGTPRLGASSPGRPLSSQPKRHDAPLPSRIPPMVRDTLRRKAGMDDLKEAFDDWEVVAGEGRVAKVSVVVRHSAKQGKRVYSTASTSSKVATRARGKDAPGDSCDDPPADQGSARVPHVS